MQKFDNSGKEKQPAPTGLLAWVGYGCTFMALASLCICFVSPYWIQTWAQSENEFKNMGLWHACFKNYVHFKDDSQEKYDGCWWVFDMQPKYYKLREWLTPPWFITCQVLTVGCLIILIACAIVAALVFLHVCPLMNHEYLQTYGMFVTGSLMLLVTLITLVIALLFGLQMNDRYWLPRPDLNYLSWGFGFLIITGIFSITGGILLYREAQLTYDQLLKKEDEYTRAALEMSTYQLEPLNPPVYQEKPSSMVYPPASEATPLPSKMPSEYPSTSAEPVTTYAPPAAQPGPSSGPGPSSYGGPSYGGPSYSVPSFGGPSNSGPSFGGPGYGGPPVVPPKPATVAPSFGGKSFQTQLDDGEDFI